MKTNDVTNNLEIQNGIVESKTANELFDMKNQLYQLNERLQSSLSDMTNYTKKKNLEILDSLNKLLEGKRSMLSITPFRFQGEPIEPIHKDINQSNTLTHQHSLASNSHFSLETNNDCVSGIHRMKPDLSNHDQNKNNHLIIKDFSESILINHNQNHSININNGCNSIVKLQIQGTIYAHDLHNCVLLVDCHQLRLHSLNNCIVITPIQNEIVMEHCENVKISSSAKVNDFNWQFGQQQSAVHYERIDVQESYYLWINAVSIGSLQPQVVERVHRAARYRDK